MLALSMWIWIPLASLAAVLIVGLWLLLRLGPPGQVVQKILHDRMASLQEEHFQLCAASGKPRGLRWSRIEWSDDYQMARDRKSGMWIAFVGTTIQFEAIEGSEMEGHSEVGHLRTATAVFFFDRGDWRTSGRMLFNMQPEDAIAQFAQQYEKVDIDDLA